MHSEDERTFAALILKCQHPWEIREAVEGCIVPFKRCAYYLDKWSTKGWYDYGVSLYLGWLEPLGREKLQEIVGGGLG